MAYVINKIDVLSRSQVRAKRLSCMEGVKNCPIVRDSESIKGMIEKVSSVKKIIEADTFEKENKILKCTDSKNSVKK